MRPCPECSTLASEDAAYCSVCGAAQPTTHPSPSLSNDDANHAARLADELRRSLAPGYELTRQLGAGGMGSVFLAWEPALKRFVAVKVLSPYLASDSTAYARFQREAHAIAALSHPNILSIYAVGKTADLGLPYIVMQYVDGPSLSDWMEQRGKAGEREARRILGSVAAALAAAHARGLVHRDIKPGNILLEASSNRVLVADFGLTAALSKESPVGESTKVTAAGAVIGTPVYMSPEQASGEPVGAKSDVYSLGMVAYELLSGENPFTAKSAMGWAAAHLRDVPKPISQRVPDLSPEIARLVDRCLAKSAEDRPTAQEFAEGALPSLEAELQWPPPGLFPLLGRGRLLVRSARLAALGMLLLLFALAAPPRRFRVEDSWWLHFRGAAGVTESALGVQTESGPSIGAQVPRGWAAALALGLVAATVGSLALLIVSYPVARATGHGRAIGWRWATIYDVLADPDGRSGLLLGGTRELAAISPTDRNRILRSRRRIVAVQVAGGCWVLLVAGAWGLLIAGGLTPEGAGPVAGMILWYLVAVPFAITLGLALAAALRESRLLGVLPRRRVHTSTFAAIRHGSGDEVAEWYAALPGSPTGSSSPHRGALAGITIGYVFAVLCGFASLLVLAVITAATLTAARTVSRLGAETAAVASLLEHPNDRGIQSDVRNAWSTYLPHQDSVSDSTASDLVRSLIQPPEAGRGVPAYPSDPLKLVSLLVPDSLGQLGIAAAMGPSLLKLPEEAARMLGAFDQHPRTALFRRIARVRMPDIMAASTDRPLASYGTLDRVPEPPYAIFRSAAEANALAALLAISRGDWDTAERMLGENAAVAEDFLRAPSLFANRYGVGMLQQLALLPLAEVERLRGNRDQSERLVEASTQVREEILSRAWPGRLAGLAGNPRDLSPYAHAMRSPRLPAGYRVESFYGAWAGFCLNPREILSGLSPLRLPGALQTAASMTGMPHATELARLTAAMWQQNADSILPGAQPKWQHSLFAFPGRAAVERVLWCRKAFP